MRFRLTKEPRAGWTLGLASVVAFGALFLSSAYGDQDPGEPFAKERDELLARIAKGERFEESVRRFKALYEQREGVLQADKKAKDQARLAEEGQRKEAEKRRKEQDQYRKSLDYDLGWRCTMSPDPKNPVPSDEGRPLADWGKIVRKEEVRLPPKNELDEGELLTLYEVRGVARSYVFRGEEFGRDRKDPFVGRVSDLVLICQGGASTDQRLPESWRKEPLTRSGFVAKISAPPAIAKKGRWNPIHITSTKFFWAIKDVKWRYPKEGFVLVHAEVGKKLESGHYEIPTNNDLSWLLEVPPALKGTELLQPGHYVWMILGKPRFDRGLRKLVLTAEDLEGRYVRE